MQQCIRLLKQPSVNPNPSKCVWADYGFNSKFTCLVLNQVETPDIHTGNLLCAATSVAATCSA